MVAGAMSTAAQAGKSAAPKRNYASRLFGYDVFLSFALGPPPRGTHSYASDLARRLRERDFTVFFSEDEASPGEKLDSTLLTALHRSRILVVIANRSTLEEPRWVRQEVEEFRRRHPDRPIIPISVDGAVQDAKLAEQTQWLEWRDKIWLEESEEAVANGIASDGLVKRLALAPAGRRSNVKWRRLVWGVAAVLLVLAVAATVFGIYARSNAAEAKRQQGIAERNATEAKHQQGVAEENAAKAKEQQGIAESNAAEAKHQQGVAEENAAEAKRQQSIAEKNAAEAKHQQSVAEENAAEAKRQQGIAEQQKLEAQKEADVARARQFLTISVSNESTDPELSVLFAAQAVGATWRWDRLVLPEAEYELHRTIMASHVKLTLRGHSSSVTSVAWSPDGKRLGTLSDDKTAKV